mmetsp:Transcript_114411/g.180705  ORF Transcript_114411/g.180705 Transcript_114411/m.180705 type:complete len:213 (+) Transcript_114411:525-1163(+)
MLAPLFKQVCNACLLSSMSISSLSFFSKSTTTSTTVLMIDLVDPAVFIQSACASAHLSNKCQSFALRISQSDGDSVVSNWIRTGLPASKCTMERSRFRILWTRNRTLGGNNISVSFHNCERWETFAGANLSITSSMHEQHLISYDTPGIFAPTTLSSRVVIETKSAHTNSFPTAKSATIPSHSVCNLPYTQPAKGFTTISPTSNSTTTGNRS